MTPYAKLFDVGMGWAVALQMPVEGWSFHFQDRLIAPNPPSGVALDRNLPPRSFMYYE